MERFDVIIVGGGHAGAQAAIALRQGGYEGSIAIIGVEPESPYQRPPLSKDYLAGDMPWERVLIRPPAFWADRAIHLIGGTEVTAVHPHARSITVQDGRIFGYTSLVWAAGGDPRRLTCAGGALAGVHSVRNRADVERMIAELPGVAQAVVIGGGYIGLEAAAVLTKMGKQVTVVESLPRVLARVAGEDLSRFFEAEHRAHGVTLLTDATVECIEGDDRATGVRLANGTVLPADMVIVGIGIVPAVQPLIAAGAEGALGGVLVDGTCRTTLADIWAVGDVAAQATRFMPDNAIMRIESVQNANDQATTAARDIMGYPRPHAATPWFWSNQYDIRLQTVGLSVGYDQTVTRGDPATRSFSIAYLRQGQLIALDCVNMVRDYAQGRKLVEEGVMPPIDRLADPSVPLKELLPTPDAP